MFPVNGHPWIYKKEAQTDPPPHLLAKEVQEFPLFRCRTCPTNESSQGRADKAIQQIVDLLQAARCYSSSVEVFLFTILGARIYPPGTDG